MNGMIWARGHRSDWDLLAVATGDSGWSYNSILQIYRRIEDWHRAAVPNPPLIALAFKGAAKSCGIPCYANANGQMTELERRCALLNVTMRASRRVSIFRSYTGGVADKPNLTVCTAPLLLLCSAASSAVIPHRRETRIEVLRTENPTERRRVRHVS